MSDVALKVEKHGIEIETIKSMMVSNNKSLERATSAQEKSTEAQTALTSQLAVYCEKNEHHKEQIAELKVDQEKIQEKVTQAGLDIADMHPTVKALRGVFWKISGATIGSGAIIAGLIVAANKVSG